MLDKDNRSPRLVMVACTPYRIYPPPSRHHSYIYSTFCWWQGAHIYECFLFSSLRIVTVSQFPDSQFPRVLQFPGSQVARKGLHTSKDGAALVYKKMLGPFLDLHALVLVEYEKIAMRDADMLGRDTPHEINDLFDITAPAAVRREASGDTETGKRLTSFLKFDDPQSPTGRLVGGINAGVMVMKPDAEAWANMHADIIRIENKTAMSIIDGPGTKSTQPEHEYLSRFYNEEWTALGVEYNIQVCLKFYDMLKHVRAKYA